MNPTKYNYLNVIQQNYGQGWEDVSEYAADSGGNSKEVSDKLSPTGKKETLCSHDLREYKLMGYATRVIFRKEPNPDYKPKTKVQFLVDDSKSRNSFEPEVFAYFPEMAHNDRLKTSYAHIGQHGPCSSEYAAASRPATPEEYKDLKAELEGIGYTLEIIQPATV